MSQWGALKKLDAASQRRVAELYDKTGFNREIRHWLSGWIENQDWYSAARDESTALNCFLSLLMNLDEEERRSVQENNILNGPDFSKLKNYLLQHFLDDPPKLAKLLCECLQEENQILTAALKAQSNPAVGQSNNELDIGIDQLKQQILVLKKEIQNVDLIQQHPIGMAHSHTLSHLYLQTTIQASVEFARKVIELAEVIVRTLTEVELSSWQRRQQLACIGSPVDTKLDQLQKWFTGVGQVLLDIDEQLEKLQKHSSSNTSVADLQEFPHSLLRGLLSKALVVEKQPAMKNSTHRPLIVRTGVYFNVTLRFLGHLPGLEKFLKVKADFDKDVEIAKTNPGFRIFEFSTNASEVMNVNTQTGALMAEFEGLLINEREGRIKGKKCFVGVTEELHMIKFVMTYQHGRHTYDIQASSLPMVVITSNNQISKAWASILWWHMLSSRAPWNLLLFADPPPMSWEQLSKVLSWQFLSVGQRELEERQLSMIKGKILCGSENDLVDWNTFSQNNWMWIDGILNMIKKYFMTFWRDGHILGFVSREAASSLLQEKPTGTFMLRFSETKTAGSITFSWVEHTNNGVNVHAVAPYDQQELEKSSLPDIINDYNIKRDGKCKNPLLFLYPDIPKERIFGQCVKDSDGPTPDGYLPRKPVSVSFPSTPPPSPFVEPSPAAPSPVDPENDMDTSVDSFPIGELFPNLQLMPSLSSDPWIYQQDVISSPLNLNN